MNWWLSTVPETVYATGARNFYRPETADRYGLTGRGDRCLDCVEAERCPFSMDLRAYPTLKSMYLENEQYDGYYRDRCVFSSEIDIEDTMDVAVTYRNGARMSYSLHAFMPWEGYVVTFRGARLSTDAVTAGAARSSRQGRGGPRVAEEMSLAAER